MYISRESDLSHFTDQEITNLLGGKGAGLYRMSKAGVNVPPFVVIPTTMYAEFVKDEAGTMAKIKAWLPSMLDLIEKQFGMGYMPLISVRSGARVSCPGMMDTILNVGLCPENEQEWAGRLQAECYSDSMHRLITMFGNVVHGLDRHELEKDDVISAMKYFNRKVGEFPSVEDQILQSIAAVFRSWDNERAVEYRKINNIPGDWGTAVTLQAMVFGNLNENSGTGVMFTRNPSSGEPEMRAEFLINAQGEDVVAGIKTPMPLKDMKTWNYKMYDQVLAAAVALEASGRDAQDIEFTIQDGELFLLQTRDAKRTHAAAVRIAYDLNAEGKIDRDIMFKRLTPKTLMGACHPSVDESKAKKPDFNGIPACAGVATGQIVHKAAKAVELAAQGKSVILVTKETTPDDIAGMYASKGVLTMTGGSTSHAAVVALSMNRPCVVGLTKEMSKFPEGAVISICGETGRVWWGQTATIPGNLTYVDRINDLLMENAVEIVNDVPRTTRKFYSLDLSDKIHYTREELAAFLKAVREKTTDTLYVSCAVPPAQGEVLRKYYELIFSPDLIKTQFEITRDVLHVFRDQSDTGTKVKIISTGKDADVPMVDIMNLEDLVMLEAESTAFVSLMGKMTESQTKAKNKVLKWLKDDGVKLKSFNHPNGMDGDFVARTKIAQAKLG